MALKNVKPLTIKPKGVCDALDGTNAFKGAMSSLANLIFDATTEDLYVPRPGAVQLTSFPGDDTSIVNALFIFGDIAYGLVNIDNLSYPFAFNLVSMTFVTISGVTSMNVPIGQNTGGPFFFIDLISTKIIVVGNGFSRLGSGYFGTIDISTPASPAWSVGSTATHALPSVPTVVKNFNNRAYFVCGNKLYFSDVLDPNTITNASQFLVLGDTTSIIALSTLPFNTTSGGVIAGLLAFKNTIIYQITGDSALTDLVLSAISTGIGTYAPLSVCNTPAGVAFIAADGLRLVDLVGNVTPPIGSNGQGVSEPFITSDGPLYICAAFNIDTLRIAVGTNAAANMVEYWYNMTRKAWTGPHFSGATNLTAPYYIQPYKNTFITAILRDELLGLGGLYQSDIIPTTTSVYTENGLPLIFQYQTCLLMDTGLMAQNSIIESTIAMAFENNSGGSVTIQFLDENQNVLDTVIVTKTSSTALEQIQIPWTIPIVFKQGYVKVRGTSFSGFKIGNTYLKYQPLGYLISG